MNNKILALKYRPQEFKDLIGQDEISKTIYNSIKINKSSYSYKCFVVSRDFCILPSFGHFTGGIDVKSQVFSDIIDKDTFLIILGKTKIAQQKVI